MSPSEACTMIYHEHKTKITLIPSKRLFFFFFSNFISASVPKSYIATMISLFTPFLYEGHHK